MSFLDRSGRLLELRPLVAQDAEALFLLHEALIRDGRGMVLTLDEAHPAPALAEKIDEVHGHGGLFLGAFHGPRLVGTLDLSRIPRSMLRHNAGLGMGIHPDFQGVGLGRRLMEEALDFARREGISRVELYVRGDNERAQALYRSVGFAPIHLRKGFVRLPSGEVLDDWLMEWTASEG